MISEFWEDAIGYGLAAVFSIISIYLYSKTIPHPQDRKFPSIRLVARRAASGIIRIFRPNGGECLRCGRPWSAWRICRSRSIWITPSEPVIAVCDHCWNHADPESLVAYYESQLPEGFPDEVRENWEGVIEGVILMGEPDRRGAWIEDE